MILLLTIYSIVLCFSYIDLTRSIGANDHQTCNVSCQAQDETCRSQSSYYYCLKTKTGGTNIDCDQELNETEEYICEYCHSSNFDGLRPDDVERTLKCSMPFLYSPKVLGVVPSKNCRFILDYLECRSEAEVHIKCKNYRGVGRPPSYKDLHGMASNLCSGANGSLYTTCDRFLEEYIKIFDVEDGELLIRLSNGSWWCQSFMKVLIAAGINIPSGVDCETLAYDSLSKNMSLKYHANWTEYCISQDAPPSRPSSDTSPTSISSSNTSSTFRPSSDTSPSSRSTTLPPTYSGSKYSTISSHTEIPVKMTERNNGGEQNTVSGYLCLLAYGLAAVVLK